MRSMLILALLGGFLLFYSTSAKSEEVFPSPRCTALGVIQLSVDRQILDLGRQILVARALGLAERIIAIDARKEVLFAFQENLDERYDTCEDHDEEVELTLYEAMRSSYFLDGISSDHQGWICAGRTMGFILGTDDHDSSEIRMKSIKDSLEILEIAPSTRKHDEFLRLLSETIGANCTPEYIAFGRNVVLAMRNLD